MSLLLGRVIVGTAALFAAWHFALVGFIGVGVVLLLFPAVTHLAVDPHLTPFIVVIDVFLHLPVYALLSH